MKKSKSKPAPKKAFAKKASAPSSLEFKLDPRTNGLEPLMGAAYLLTDRAYARLDGDKTKSLVITLTPKGDRSPKALAALKADFLAELESQKLRWAVTRNNQPVREYVAEHALSLAEEHAKRLASAAAASAPKAEPTSEQLTSEQKSEIERLIAEVEAEISQMNKEEKLADPKERALSWEAANEKEQPKA